ncbi:MAG: M20/M25/M40 family metallo-hydrolase [Armatimonadetes bacterium]|nr:M20/M25/M40 family metallo-hydrolase [Armatimonadota bacterium]MDW8029579.1 M20/M25/M40 family metallo-hydrolase [Armatimonadota bacterium]
MTVEHQLRELVRILVETPTPTGNEKALFPFLTEYLKSHGFGVTEQEVTERHPLTPTGEYSNLVAKRGESRFLISAHLDTFPAYSHPQPYTLREEGDRLIARGVVDIKGQIAALLLAVSLTDAPCQIAFVCDEERGGIGSRNLKFESEGVLVLEPTDLKPVVAHAGAVEGTALFFGKAAHGSTPHWGENALEKAIAFADALKTHPLIADQRHPLFERAPLVTIGKLEGGSEAMVVPNKALLNFDIRVLPGYSAKAVSDLVSDFGAKFKAELKIDDVAEPVTLDENEKVVKAIKHAVASIAGQEPSAVGYWSWTDAVNYIQRGVPAVVFGAGHLGVAHSDEEWVKFSDLLTLSQILVKVMEIWA